MTQVGGLCVKAHASSLGMVDKAKDWEAGQMVTMNGKVFLMGLFLYCYSCVDNYFES